jgi:hydroxymethylglutaryl-CoA lyase
MPDLVTITDVAPRDGLQNEAALVPTDDKAALIRAIAATNVDAIEYTSFVSPKWIPQLGDAQKLLNSLADLRHQPDSPGCIVLVPNKQGYERSLQFHTEQTPLAIAIFTAASEAFNKKNTNATITESIARFREFLPDALAHDMRVRLYISTVIACPFQGPIAPKQVREVVDQLYTLVPQSVFESRGAELDLGDTIGSATPDTTQALLEQFTASERETLVLHFHDTFGRAADCVALALEMGVRSFDGSVAGLGGCPYASQPGSLAPGNINTRVLVEAVHNAGFTINIDLDALTRAEQLAADILQRARVESAR